MKPAEAEAVALYAIGARDWSEFLDDVKEAPDETLDILLRMLAPPGRPGTDVALNAILHDVVAREITARTYRRPPRDLLTDAEKAERLRAINNPSPDDVD